MHNLYSKRAQEWALAGQYNLTSIIKDKYIEDSNNLENTFHIFRKRLKLETSHLEFWGKVRGDLNTPAHLVSVHYSGDLPLNHRAFVESLCHLLKDKSRLQIVKISAREVEYFLRDQNHLPALYLEKDKKIGSEFELFFKIIPELIEEMLLFEGEDEAFDILPSGQFKESPTLPMQLRLVESFLDRQVRKALKQDGGNVLIKAINKVDDVTQVYLHFSGECQSCSSSKFGTWQFIQTSLEKYFKGQVLAVPYDTAHA